MRIPGLSTSRVRVYSLLALAGLAFLLTGSSCPQSNATISAFVDQEFQTAEDIGVTGTGFTPNGQVRISFIGVPGRSSPVTAGTVTADSTGSFDKQVYRFTFTASLVCDVNATQTMTVSATDLSTGAVTFAAVDVSQCAFF